MQKTKDAPFPVFPGKKGGLRRQILTFTMVAFFVGTLAIVLSLLQASRIIMRKNRTESTLEQISHTAYVVEQDLNAVQELMDYFFVDKQLQAALEQPVETAYDRTLQWNQLYSALSTYERLDCFRDINCILIYNADGYAHSFRYKAVDTSAYSQRNQVLGWYRAALENEGRLVWGTDVSPSAEDYAAFDQKLGADISAMRALRVQSYKRIQGAVYLSIEPTCLSLLRPSNGLEGMDYFLLDDAGRLLNDGADMEQLQMCRSMLENAPWDGKEYRSHFQEGATAYEYVVPTYGYRLLVLQKDANDFAMEDAILRLGLVILFIFLFIGLSMWTFLTRRVMRPVYALADTMQRVDTQGLSVRAQGGGSTEFDYLAGSFNRMLERVQTLMETNLENERAVQEAEHKAVLAQINPHFVYNALFAIRMMAVMQGADNIQDMVDALWRMLKNSTSRASACFTLKDEIQNIKDYVHILKATNVHKFDITYRIPAGMEALPCPKFLIQPVVENAVLHGVLPKQGFSNIDVAAGRDGDWVTVTVSNDGLPIAADRLAEVNSSLNQAHKGLGLSSIHQRLRLLYGRQAGLTITSDEKLGKTVVRIRYRVKEGSDNV